jgi:hypothetical protein
VHPGRPRVRCFKLVPFNSNGLRTVFQPLPLHRTNCPAPDKCPVTFLHVSTVLSSAPHNAPDRRTLHRTNVRCLHLARARANRELVSTGQSLTGQSHCPVLCPVRTASHRMARVSHRTNRACHRACPVHPWHICPVHHSSLSRSRQLKQRAPEHRT